MYVPEGPALGLIELCSVARGLTTCDAMVKKAAVELVRATSIHPGKYLILVRGAVAEVKEAWTTGRTVAAEMLVDDLFLPFPHAHLDELLDAPRNIAVDSVGILETFSVASVLRGADAALKGAEIEGVLLRLADHLGGKGYFVFSGALEDVEAAMEVAVPAVGSTLVAGQETIANPHPDVLKFIS